MEEIDWSTGRILDTLAELGLDENTLVLFTSDNGSAREKQGSNLPLRGRKGRTDEGGIRVPCLVRWPQGIAGGRIVARWRGRCDVLPTFAKLAGGEVPTDRMIDGKNILAAVDG